MLFLCFAPSTQAKTTEELQQVEHQLTQQKQQAEVLDAKARETSVSLQELRQKLIEAAAHYQAKAEEQEGRGHSAKQEIL